MSPRNLLPYSHMLADANLIKNPLTVETLLSGKRAWTFAYFLPLGLQIRCRQPPPSESHRLWAYSFALQKVPTHDPAIQRRWKAQIWTADGYGNQQAPGNLPCRWGTSFKCFLWPSAPSIHRTHSTLARWIKLSSPSLNSKHTAWNTIARYPAILLARTGGTRRPKTTPISAGGLLLATLTPPTRLSIPLRWLWSTLKTCICVLMDCSVRIAKAYIKTFGRCSGTCRMGVDV